MSKREVQHYSYMANSKAALKLLNKQGLKFLDESLIWQILSYEFEHYDIPTEVISHDLSIDSIVYSISNYYTQFGLPVQDIKLTETIIPEEFYENSLSKANVKFDGEIWVVHKNDVDPFPSNPHAHNYTERLKLHLGNGKLYRKKVQVGRISTKDLLSLRSLITGRIKDIKLPAYTK